MAITDYKVGQSVFILQNDRDFLPAIVTKVARKLVWAKGDGRFEIAFDATVNIPEERNCRGGWPRRLYTPDQIVERNERRSLHKFIQALETKSLTRVAVVRLLTVIREIFPGIEV